MPPEGRVLERHDERCSTGHFGEIMASPRQDAGLFGDLEKKGRGNKHEPRQMSERERVSWLWSCEPRDEIDLLAWLLERWRVDPVSFAVEALRVILLPYQAAILLDLADSPGAVYDFYGVDPSKPKRHVLVPSGHGTGKTRTIAIAVWWQLLCHRFSKVLITAPSQNQLSTQLWGELHKMNRRLKQAQPRLAEDWELLGSSINHVDEANRDWMCIARTARPERPEALQGAHALDDDDQDGQLANLFGEERDLSARGGIMVVLEEASGIDDRVRETLAGALSERGARLLAPGNPTRPDGWFADDLDRTDTYAVHPIDCRDSDRDTFYELPYRDFGGRIHRLKARGLVPSSYWKGELEVCEGNEERDRFRVRVRGLKPRSRYESVMQRKWIAAAQQRDPDPASRGAPVVVSLDFGLTNDMHALAVVRGFSCLLIQEWLPEHAPEQITLAAVDRAVDAVRTWGARFVIGDSNALGRGAMERLHEIYRGTSVRVIFFNSGQAAHDTKRYHRRRDEMWMLGRAWVSDERCSLPQYPGLADQLCAPFFEEDQSRRVKVASKALIKKETGQKSGNAADALLQAQMVNLEPAQAKSVSTERPRLHPQCFERHFARLRQNGQKKRYIDARAS